MQEWKYAVAKENSERVLARQSLFYSHICRQTCLADQTTYPMEYLLVSFDILVEDWCKIYALKFYLKNKCFEIFTIS